MTSPTNHCYYDKQNHQSNQKGNPRGSINQNNRITQNQNFIYSQLYVQ